MSNLTSSILKKWNEQGMFVRCLDGNTLNCRADNLQWVTIEDAMAHFDDWVVDWGDDLTKKERDLVRTKEWRDGLTFKKKAV